MAFTQVPVSGTVNLSNAIPASGAVVTFTLNTAITDGVTLVAPEAVSVRCASDGTFSITLNANDDSTTLPSGTYYQVVITYGTQTLETFNVIIPRADLAGVDLFALAQVTNPNVATPFVSQIVAGTGISVSPANGEGIVTVTATGGATASSLLSFTRPGNLAVETGTMRLRFSKTATINSIAAIVNTQPTGASVIVDVLKNGTTVFTTQANRPTIAASTNASGDQVPDVTNIAVGDYFTVNIAQVGSVITGADMSVSLLYH